MDAFSAFSTAPCANVGAILPSSHNNGLGGGFSTSTAPPAGAGFSGVSSPAAMGTLGSQGRGLLGDVHHLGMAGAGGVGAATGGGSVNLFSTVPASQPKATAFGLPMQAGMRPPSSERTLFATGAATVLGSSVAGTAGPCCLVRATREFDSADRYTYALGIRRTLERLQAMDQPGFTSQPRSGAASATATPVVCGASSTSVQAATPGDSAAAGGGAHTALTPTPQPIASADNAAAAAAAVTYFFGLMDAAQPQVAASRVNDALDRNAANRDVFLKAVSACLTTPAHLAILPHLADPYRAAVRDYTLQTVLEAFEKEGASGQPVPECARMLAEMLRLGLVRRKGVAATITGFLGHPNSRRAGIAAFGLVAEQNRHSDGFLKEMRQLSTTEAQLLQLYKDPEYEYDVLAINRLLSASGNTADNAQQGGSADDDQVGTILRETYCLRRSDNTVPPNCLQYVPQRDEVFTAHGDGIIALWGPERAASASASSSSTGGAATVTTPVPEATVRTIVEMPDDTIAVAMAAPHRGHFIVAAGMPVAVFGPSHPFSAQWQARHPGKRPASVALGISSLAPSSGIHTAEATGGAATTTCPLLRLLVHSEGTGEWAQGGIIRRADVSAITAVAAVTQNACVCSAESAHDVTGSGEWHHNLSFINAPTGQVVQSAVDAHTDFITALATCSDKEHVLLSAARQCTVKLWDTRANNAHGAAAATTATKMVERHAWLSTQSDSITSIRSCQNLILTSSLDGSFVAWDTRDLSRPVARRQFTSPVLDVAPMEGGKWAVASARGLFLLSDSLHSMDVIPNVAFTQICANSTGELLFGTGADGVHIFSIKK